MTEHSEHDEHDGYTGPATLTCDDAADALPVAVELRGHFQPIDGRYHWWGRLAASDAVDALAGGGKKHVRLHTPTGEADGVLSDPDPWGRYRITGTSTPPFDIPTDLDH